ncbi:MAG: hypothetical protein JWM99_3503, partial [Verrucomicrobiales bacterium]|nr:hypothetical protein [Verrucomicrobiales bacterium]
MGGFFYCVSLCLLCFVGFLLCRDCVRTVLWLCPHCVFTVLQTQLGSLARYRINVLFVWRAGGSGFAVWDQPNYWCPSITPEKKIIVLHRVYRFLLRISVFFIVQDYIEESQAKVSIPMKPALDSDSNVKELSHGHKSVIPKSSPSWASFQCLSD